MSPSASALPPATDPARAFVLGDKLGTGSFGVVYKACVLPCVIPGRLSYRGSQDGVACQEPSTTLSAS